MCKGIAFFSSEEKNCNETYKGKKKGFDIYEGKKDVIPAFRRNNRLCNAGSTAGKRCRNRRNRGY